MINSKATKINNFIIKQPPPIVNTNTPVIENQIPTEPEKKVGKNHVLKLEYGNINDFVQVLKIFFLILILCSSFFIIILNHRSVLNYNKELVKKPESSRFCNYNQNTSNIASICKDNPDFYKFSKKTNEGININYILKNKPYNEIGGFLSICNNLCTTQENVSIIKSGSSFSTKKNISYDTTNDFYLSNIIGKGKYMVVDITTTVDGKIKDIKIQNFGDGYKINDKIQINNPEDNNAVFNINTNKSYINKCDPKDTYIECLQNVSPPFGCKNLPPLAVTPSKSKGLSGEGVTDTPEELYPQFVTLVPGNSC